MITNIVYLVVGCMIGFLMKYEIDYKNHKKKIKTKIATYATMRDNDDKLKECDELLQSVRSINRQLQILNKEKGV